MRQLAPKPRETQLISLQLPRVSISLGTALASIRSCLVLLKCPHFTPNPQHSLPLRVLERSPALLLKQSPDGVPNLMDTFSTEL